MDDEEQELLPTEEKTDLVGESLTVTDKEIPGWKLVEKPETNYYEYEEEEQVLIYKYERIKVQVKTQVTGKGGTIQGDETILWGEDSTKDYIIIKADEGYKIGEIKINGEVLGAVEGMKLVYLDNFIEQKEDKLVEVTFVPDNPNTTKISIKFTIILSLILIASILFIRKLSKKIYKV